MLSISGRQISHDLRQSLHCSRLLLTLRISRSSPFASWPWQQRSKMHMNLFTLNSVPTSQTILGFIIGQTTLLNLPNPLYTDSSACASLKNSLQMSTRILAQDGSNCIYIYMLNPIRKIACACNNINQNHFGWQNPAKYAITYLPKLRMRVETLTCYT